jgi:hypothetical protein
MVWYKNKDYFQYSASEAYDKLYKPGDIPDHSGIYRCESCGAEVVAEHSRALPPTHAKAAQGHKVTWRLVAYPKAPP